MTGLALILLVAALGFGLARWARLPVIPLLLFAGMGFSMTGWVPSEWQNYSVVEMGLAFLVFTAGMELNPERFGRHLKAVLWVGLVQFLVLGTCGFGAARLLGFSTTSSLYLGVALSTSSTLVVVNHLKRLHQMFEPFGRLVIGALLIQDLLMIFIIVLLAHLPEGPWSVLRAMGGTLFLTGIALVFQRWLMPFLIGRHQPDEETLLLAVLAMLFGMFWLAFQLGMPPVAGAFLAGFSLSRFPVNGVVRGLLNPLTDFFQAVFFTALGALVALPDLALVAKAICLTLLVLLVTPPLVTVVAEANGLTSRAAIETGLLLAQMSEFALVLGLTGSQVLGHVDPTILSVIALVTVLTMTATPFLATEAVTARLLLWHPLWRRMRDEPAHRNHVLVLGFGAGGRWVVKPLMQQGNEVLVVDDDPVIIAQLHQTRIPCILGDAADEKVLTKAGARQAKLILASLPRITEAEKVLRYTSPVPVMVRVFEKSEADRVSRLGGIPILNSEASADKFMDWYEKVGPREGDAKATAG